MQYRSVNEIAKKWNVSERSVQKLLRSWASRRCVSYRQDLEYS